MVQLISSRCSIESLFAALNNDESRGHWCVDENGMVATALRLEIFADDDPG
jgi:hypothetical protein